MGVLFWLEHLGLDQTRDQISMQVLGDQPIMMQAVETGIGVPCSISLPFRAAAISPSLKR
jgi:hypothetical protein